MNLLWSSFIFSTLAFITVITVVIFVHELGHFLFARLFNVRVDIFSIGFGPKILKYVDSKKTEWRLCVLPLGGYVKMHGDLEVGSAEEYDKLKDISDAEKSSSFVFKSIAQRSLIVFGGPLANYILAVLLFAVVLYFGNFAVPTNRIVEIKEDSVAYDIGLRAGDVIHSVDGVEVKNMENVFSKNLGEDPLRRISVIKNGEIYEYDIEQEDLNDLKFDKAIYDISWFEALWKGVKVSYKMSLMILDGIWKMLTGKIGSEDLGGPIKIAQYSVDAAKHGVIPFIWFVAAISLNIGLLNLLPIPILDGGRLLFYAMEFIYRRPIPAAIQSWSLRIGLTIMVLVMALATFNDVKSSFNL